MKARSEVIHSFDKYGVCKGRAEVISMYFIICTNGWKDVRECPLNASNSESETSQTSCVTSYVPTYEQGQRHP